jgi:hypothetical protein
MKSTISTGAVLAAGLLALSGSAFAAQSLNHASVDTIKPTTKTIKSSGAVVVPSELIPEDWRR